MQSNIHQRPNLRLDIVSTATAVAVSGFIIYRAYTSPGSENAGYYLLVLALLSGLFFQSLSVIGAYDTRRRFFGVIALFLTMACFSFGLLIALLAFISAQDYFPADSSLVAGLALGYFVFLMFRQIAARKQKNDTVIVNVIWTILFVTLMLVTLPLVSIDLVSSKEIKDSVALRMIAFSQVIFIAVHIIAGTSYVKYSKDISHKLGAKLETIKFFKGTAFDGNMWVQVYALLFMLPVAAALILSYVLLGALST